MVLTAEQWEAEMARKRTEKKEIVEKAKQDKIKAEKERKKNLSASFDITFTKMNITASAPDWNGVIKKKLQVAADIPFSLKTETAISKALQEPMIAEIGAKQLKLAEIQVREWELFDDEDESKVPNPVEKFDEETSEDLCTCGHCRPEHFTGRNYKHGRCRADKCKCKAFVPQEPATVGAGTYPEGSE